MTSLSISASFLLSNSTSISHLLLFPASLFAMSLFLVFILLLTLLLTAGFLSGYVYSDRIMADSDDKFEE
ncbi:hypothetical protein L6452_45227 [Arctium lappa]|nr:hypothetical protein L6452_45227 [Arctium lappa]